MSEFKLEIIFLGFNEACTMKAKGKKIQNLKSKRNTKRNCQNQLKLT